MKFRKSQGRSARLAAILLSCLMACEGMASGQARPGLRIGVVQGEGAINSIQSGFSRDLVVEVRRQNSKPVAGAKVTFALPEAGNAQQAPDAGSAQQPRRRFGKGKIIAGLVVVGLIAAVAATRGGGNGETTTTPGTTITPGTVSVGIPR